MATTPADTAESMPPGRRALLVVSVLLATLLYTIDATIANVALPHMQGALQASQDQVAWVITSYVVATAVFMPLLTWLSGRFGQGRVLMISVAAFTFTSMLCGIATSLQEIVIFRILQGIAGAALGPVSQTLLLNAFPRERHGQAMAIFMIGMMLGPIIGPTLGGIITDALDWRWIFFVNVPLGILSLIGIALSAPRHERHELRRLDRFGFVLLALGIGLLQLFLDRGTDRDWFNSAEIVVTASLAAACLYMFVVHSATTAHPFFSPSLLTDRNFLLGCAMNTMIAVVAVGVSVLLPMYLEQVQHYPVADAGLLVAPRGAGMVITSLLVGQYGARFDARLLVVAGALANAVSLWGLSHLTLDLNASGVAWNMFLQGLGTGLVTVPVSTLMFATLPIAQRMEAATLATMIRFVAQSVGVSIAITLLVRGIRLHQSGLVEHLSQYDTGKWDLLDRALGSDATALMADEVTRQATVLAYSNDYTLMLIGTLLLIPMVFLLQMPRRQAARSAAGTSVDAH